MQQLGQALLGPRHDRTKRECIEDTPLLHKPYSEDLWQDNTITFEKMRAFIQSCIIVSYETHDWGKGGYC